MYAVMMISDEDGNKVFDLDDVEALMDKNARILDEILKQSMIHNGLGNFDEDDDEEPDEGDLGNADGRSLSDAN